MIDEILMNQKKTAAVFKMPPRDPRGSILF